MKPFCKKKPRSRRSASLASLRGGGGLGARKRFNRLYKKTPRSEKLVLTAYKKNVLAFQVFVVGAVSLMHGVSKIPGLLDAVGSVFPAALKWKKRNVGVISPQKFIEKWSGWMVYKIKEFSSLRSLPCASAGVRSKNWIVPF